MKLLLAFTAFTLFGVAVGDHLARADFDDRYRELIARDKAWAEAYQRVEDIAEHWGMEMRAMNGNCAYDPLMHSIPAREISYRR